mmetsp:Transcript_69115/g.162609  ORF Transcript_69115/g.162609 Transcript_69115/m.162609 type:complete len:170 (+) Transcript_69115:35-544(+)
MQSALKDVKDARDKAVSELRKAEAEADEWSERYTDLKDECNKLRTKLGMVKGEVQQELAEADKVAQREQRATEKVAARAAELEKMVVELKRENASLREQVERLSQGFQVAKTIGRIRQVDVSGKKPSRAVGFDSLLNTVDSVVKTVDHLEDGHAADSTALMAAVRAKKR